jgi:hypothetical protein
MDCIIIISPLTAFFIRFLNSDLRRLLGFFNLILGFYLSILLCFLLAAIIRMRLVVAQQLARKPFCAFRDEVRK